MGGDCSEAMTLGEWLSDPPAEEAFERVPQRLAMEDLPRLLGLLSKREQEVLPAPLGIGTTVRPLREVAGGLGVSAERVRQIEQAAREKPMRRSWEDAGNGTGPLRTGPLPPYQQGRVRDREEPAWPRR